MNKSPLISFALFAYNQEKFIREAIYGAFSQNYEPLEIILSDDCSTDSTFSIMQEMCAEYKGAHRILLNRNETNLGVGEHVNRVALLASGNWFVMSAGDDVSVPDRCKIVSDAINNYFGAVAIITGVDEINSEGHKIPFTPPSYLSNERIDRFGDWDWIRKFQIKEGIGTPGCSATWHRSLFTLFPPLAKDVIAEDVVLGLRAYLTGGVVYLKDILVHHRIHENNLSANKNVKISEKIKNTVSFEFRLLPTYRQCISDLQSVNETLPIDRFTDLMSFLSYNLKLSQLRAVWWSMPWYKRFKEFITLLRGSDKMDLFYWISHLFPWWLFIGVHKIHDSLRKY